MEKHKIETYYTILSYEELDISQQALINKAKEEVKNAYAPYSNFQVGAAVELENGEFIGGSNQENAAYPSGLCAERVAVFYANAKYPNIAIKSIAIAAYTKNNFLKQPITPCGSCRQVLLESEIRFDKNINILLYGTEKIYLLENVKQLMPMSFENSSLGEK